MVRTKQGKPGNNTFSNTQKSLVSRMEKMRKLPANLQKRLLDDITHIIMEKELKANGATEPLPLALVQEVLLASKDLFGVLGLEADRTEIDIFKRIYDTCALKIPVNEASKLVKKCTVRLKRC